MMLTRNKVIFKSGNICKVCNCRVLYFAKQPYKYNDKLYVTCPTCNNEIQITE
jgi:hypothetical protein